MSLDLEKGSNERERREREGGRERDLIVNQPAVVLDLFHQFIVKGWVPRVSQSLYNLQYLSPCLNLHLCCCGGGARHSAAN